MADLLVNPNGTSNDITVPANSAISVWSLSAFDVLQVSSTVNGASSVSFLGTRAANGDMFTSSVFSATASTIIRIQAQGGADVWYSIGTNPIVRSGFRQLTPYQVINPTNFAAINVTGTASIANLMAGYITSSTAAAVTITAPTAAIIDAATTLAVGDSFDVVLINTGGTNALVLSGGVGNTYLGTISATAGGMTARFVKTAAGAFTVFRV